MHDSNNLRKNALLGSNKVLINNLFPVLHKKKETALRFPAEISEVPACTAAP